MGKALQHFCGILRGKKNTSSESRPCDGDFAIQAEQENYDLVCQVFDKEWYLETYRDVAEDGIDPIKHYISIGYKEGRNPNRFFESEWYLSQNTDVRQAVMNPLVHYLRYGEREGRRPNKDFDAQVYVQNNPDVADAGVPPFQHFVTKGYQEGRTHKGNPRPSGASADEYKEFFSSRYEERGATSPDFVPDSPDFKVLSSPQDLKVVAFYLPQFHPIPENDRWWGRGFTEWTNVTAAQPQFIGHNQPHLPIDLGFYDLRRQDVLERQVELAQKYGISAFCFHYYWFSGKRLLEKPLDMFLNLPELPLEFCICWANENWTRRWDGREKDILIGQNHSPEDDLAVAADFARYFNDSRYIRIGNKPLLVIYRLELLPDANRTLRIWRDFFRKQWGYDVFIVGARTFGRDLPKEFEVDAVIEFPPHNMADLVRSEGLKILNPNFSGNIFDYASIVRGKSYLKEEDRTVFKTVFPGWDNTARSGGRATIFNGSSPTLYKEWLKDVLLHTRRTNSKDCQLVFVNAWNEWAEGAHLEPDRKLGYGNLKATAEAIIETRDYSLDGKEITSWRNKEIYDWRWRRLEELFGPGLNRAEGYFLVEYLGLFESAWKRNEGEYRFSVKDGTLYFESNGERRKIDSRRAIRIVADKLGGIRENGPFCFVILQFNKPELTINCIRHLQSLAHGGQTVKFVVVDNGSTEANQDVTRGAFDGDPDILVIFNQENLGFAQGNNIGYKYCRDHLGASFVCVLNNDVEIRDVNFLEVCKNVYNDWSFSLLGPRVVTPDGREENPYCDWIPAGEEWQLLLEQFKARRARYQETGQANFSKFGSTSPRSSFIVNPILQGAAFIASPLFLDRYEEFFDPRTFLYGEEFILAARALVEGDLLLYASNIAVHHLEGATTSELVPDHKIYLGYDGPIKALEISASLVVAKVRKSLGKLVTIEPNNFQLVFEEQKENILIDLFFCQPGYHGGGEYGKAVFRELVSSASQLFSGQLWAALDPNLFIDPWVKELCAEMGVFVISVKGYNDIIELVNKDIFTTFFCPALVVYTGYEYMTKVGGPLPFTCTRTRVLGTVHDLRDVELSLQRDSIDKARRSAASPIIEYKVSEQLDVDPKKQQSQMLLEMYQRIVTSKSLSHVFTDSGYSRRVLLSFFGELRDKLTVAYAPLRMPERPALPIIAGIDVATVPFALALNGSRYEKNVISAVRAFDMVLSSRKDRDASFADMRMIIVGARDFEDIGIRDILNPDRFVFTDHLRASELEFLYQKAKFLFYISFNEGFGYPPLEAMRYGTPSLVSNVTSIPEVCGEAAVYCDPFDIDSICSGIIQIVDKGIDEQLMTDRLAYVSMRQQDDLRMLIEEILLGQRANQQTIGLRRVAHG